MTKVCFKCNEGKPLSEFYTHSRMADGHLNKCKDCTKRDVKEHRAASYYHLSTYERTRNQRPERRSARCAIAARYKALHPLEKWAHRKVQVALRSGRLKKEPCSVCGSTQFLRAHHPDYSKPLDVVWLCARHHAQHHSKAA